jgi:ABC-type microcin C transport system duplicated ATPase subunit YejF
MLDPIADAETVVRAKERALEKLDGKKIGYVFNQHVTALAFWKKFEGEIGDRLKPSGVHSVYKINTWAPAPRADLDRLAAEVDFALVGVGA